MTSVTKDVVRAMIIEKVIPAIKNVWPSSSKKVIIQQDNTKPHCATDDELLSNALNDPSWDISLRCQPPNSPDLNVLGLGYFNSIQSLQHKKVPRSIDDLVKAVTDSFVELHPDKLDNVFLSLQMAMEETM